MKFAGLLSSICWALMFWVQTTQTQLACQDGYFVQNTNCQPCPSTCTKCSSLTSCSECKFDYLLKNGACSLDCGYGCDSCLIKGYCSQCKVGYYQSYSSCVPCSSNCDKCNSYVCQQCSSGYYLDNDSDICMSEKSNNSVGGAVGGSLGGCCCCVLIIVGIYCCCCKKNNQVEQQANKQQFGQIGDVSMVPMDNSHMTHGQWAPPNQGYPMHTPMAPHPMANPWSGPPPLMQIQATPFGVGGPPASITPYSPPQVDMSGGEAPTGAHPLPPGFLGEQRTGAAPPLPPGFESAS